MNLAKGLLISSTLVLSLLISNSASAENGEQLIPKEEEVQFNQYMEEVTKELDILNRDTTVFEELTDKDFERLLPQVLEIEAQNPDLSKDELNELVYQFFVDLKANSVATIRPFYISIGGANSQEVKLCAFNPIDCSKAKANASSAGAKSEEYYSVGLYNGNGDAFRHAYWNVLMVSSIGSEMAYKFANAHEYGDDDQPALEQDMDLHNNRVGRSLKGSTATQVKSAISRGLGVRIVNNKLVDTTSYGAR
ncbi:MAG: DUF6973 domain-containing protein [Exiguobacterium mexicanum]